MSTFLLSVEPVLGTCFRIVCGSVILSEVAVLAGGRSYCDVLLEHLMITPSLESCVVSLVVVPLISSCGIPVLHSVLQMW